MPLPRIEGSWQWLTGINLGPRLDMAVDPRGNEIVLAIVNAWLGFPLKPWEVMGSSNSVSAGMDRVNRWLAPTDIVWTHDSDEDSVVPRSWIVMRNAAGLHLLLECILDEDDLRFMISRIGFTGGSPTARPTAVDEVEFGNAVPGSVPATVWLTDFDDYGADVFNWMHILHARDGRATYMFFTGTGAGSVSGTPQGGQGYQGSLMIGEMAEAPPAVSKPFFALLDRTGSLGSMFQNAWNSMVGCFLPTGATQATIAIENGYDVPTVNGSPYLGVAPCLNEANQISGERPMQPVFVYHATTGAWLGRIKDAWLAGGSAGGGTVSGTTFPAGGPARLAQFGPWVVPWSASLGPPLVGKDELLYLSKSPSTSTYGLPNPSPYASSGFTAPIVLTFSDVIDPSTVVLDYKRQNSLPAMSAYNPASTIRIWIKAPGGPALVPTVEVSLAQLKIHNTGDGPADTWQTPGGNSIDVRIYLTEGIKNLSGVALTLPVALPAATATYHWQDDD